VDVATEFDTARRGFSGGGEFDEEERLRSGVLLLMTMLWREEEDLCLRCRWCAGLRTGLGRLRPPPPPSRVLPLLLVLVLVPLARLLGIACASDVEIVTLVPVLDEEEL
jgi:hypothetical protein